MLPEWDTDDRHRWAPGAGGRPSWRATAVAMPSVRPKTSVHRLVGRERAVDGKGILRQAGLAARVGPGETVGGLEQLPLAGPQAGVVGQVLGNVGPALPV